MVVKCISDKGRRFRWNHLGSLGNCSSLDKRRHTAKGYTARIGRTAKGMNIVNLRWSLVKITAMIPVNKFSEDEFLVMTTRNGICKRIKLSDLETARKGGIRALTLEEGDELISVRRTDGNQQMILATRNGMAICFDENDVRPMGRTAMGVRGIKLEGDDFVIGAVRTRPNATLLTITDNGYGKRTPIDEYLRGGEDAREPQKRGGKGLLNYRITENWPDRNPDGYRGRCNSNIG